VRQGLKQELHVALRTSYFAYTSRFSPFAIQPASAPKDVTVNDVEENEFISAGVLWTSFKVEKVGMKEVC